MYRSFHIQNFRCFEDLSIGPFARVNLITGANDAGKTALLEALFLHTGRGNLAFPASITGARGLHPATLDPIALWGWLFRNRDIDQIISIIGDIDPASCGTLELLLVPSGITRIAGGNDAGPGAKASAVGFGAARADRELVGRYREGPFQSEAQIRSADGPDGVSEWRARFVSGPGGLEVQAETGQRPQYTSLQAFFISTRATDLDSELEAFSHVVRSGKLPAVLSCLQHLDPRTQHLQVLTDGHVPAINASIDGIPEPIPLRLLGDGVVRLVNILTCLYSAGGGYVLIDEVENGIHHAAMEGAWAAIASAARDADVQVFATTHSWECITAAYTAFAKSAPEDLRLFRLERVKGHLKAFDYDSEILHTALEAGLEVR